MKKTQLLFLFGVFAIFIQAKADEGMWLLSMIDGYTIEDMQSKGFKLSAEDIYSVNQACLKDAVVIFGGGCTGEMISGNGLVLTNHHCGYGAIQSHSSVENDYLSDGFWAMSREEELPNQGLSVRFLRYMKDVGNQVFEGVDESLPLNEKDAKINSNIARIVKEANEEGKFEALVRPMFYGNQYFLFVYERFNDVRLVGAPPSSIGNFGQDNDNWMWPRHTGDFSMFRVYANKNNEPAEYSEENIPYTPRKFLEISTDGVKEGDFTMLLGYPGSTEQFLYSKALEILMDNSLPLKIDLRTQRMGIMDKYMQSSDKVRIQYASKYRGVSNAWKKWQGAIKGLERLDAVQRKLEYEQEIKAWVNETNTRKAKYQSVFAGFDDIYAELSDYQLIYDLMSEAIFAVESFGMIKRVESYIMDSVDVDNFRKRLDNMYKNYHMPIDRDMLAIMLKNYRNTAPDSYHPEIFNLIDGKYKGDIKAYADKAFSKSYVQSREAMDDLVDIYEKNPEKALKKLKKDPILQCVNQFYEIFSSNIRPSIAMFYNSLDRLYKTYVQAIFQFEPDVRQYPDANFTMRLTYGQVKGYEPRDAVIYDYYTTLSGVIEKNKEGKYDYQISEKLIELYDNKNYGDYGANDTLKVCFTASNHTSGGNSGSPVIDANGRLIGINFDRNWEGTMSDEMYDPEMCRNISVDIRYILFIVDKYAGAGYLLDEMVLVND